MTKNIKYYSRRIEVLGSFLEITLPDNNIDLFEKCFNEARRIENKFTRFNKSSPLSKLNSKLNQWQKTDAEFIYLLKKANDINKKTKGYFDITIKKTLDTIGYDSNYTFENKYKNKINYMKFISHFLSKIKRNILINEKESKIKLKKEIDFGGFGKGYAIDKIRTIIEKANINEFIINAGGDIYVKGKKEIKIDHPIKKDTSFAITIIENSAICTSSAKHRKWNKSSHHLINPKKNISEQTSLQTTIIGQSSLETDAYATGLFAAGFEKALKISQKNKINSLIISSDFRTCKNGTFNLKLIRSNDNKDIKYNS